MLDRDREEVFRFAPLQGEAATRLLSGLSGEDLMQGMVLYEGGRSLQGHVAVLRVAEILYPRLSFLIPAFRAAPLRWVGEFVYRVIARNRYRWFGRRSACRMPTEAWRRRFLD